VETILVETISVETNIFWWKLIFLVETILVETIFGGKV
jgi:hypothetical protein